MKTADMHRIRPARARAALRVEGLESRCLLSGKSASPITINEVPGFSPGTTALSITDTTKNDSISINDNGTGTAGNIFVSFGSGQDYMSIGGVTMIQVKIGKGTDHVTYELDGNLQPNVDQLVEVGSNSKKGGGSIVLTENVVGKVLDMASLAVLAIPIGLKHATMTVNDSGEIDGNLTTGISPFGTKGIPHTPEAISFNSTATIGSGGNIEAGLFGSTKNDMASVSYSGIDDGEFDAFEKGNGGNDQLDADVYMVPGSTGTIGDAADPSLIQSSGKKDKLRFTIYQGTDSTSTSNIFAELIDRSRKDVSSHTANVTAHVKGVDSIVP